MCIDAKLWLREHFEKSIKLSKSTYYRASGWNWGGSKRWTFSETMDIRDFTVCIIHCVYRAELILAT